jgi:hypothetical protein
MATWTDYTARFIESLQSVGPFDKMVERTHE